MKNSRTLLAATFSIVVLAAISFTSVYSLAQDQKVPTRKELVTLLKTAKEPADHLRIAAYYKQEAAHQRQIAKDHEGLAVIYGETHPFAGLESKHGASFGQGASHCKKFAELALEEAKEADALVTLHQNMAKEAEQKQQ